MSFQLVQACIDMRGGLLTPAQKASLLVICRFADDKGMNSFPKLETIAERTEFNRRTILEAVKGLIENGWITAVRTQYGRNFSVSVNKIMANKADTADVQKPAHVHEVTHVKEPAHVQETTSRCAGSCTADVQEPAHRRDQLKEQEENSKDVPRPKTAKKEPQGSRFTLEELPDNWHSECRRIQPKADPHKVFEEFRDYWISVPGAKGRKSDWTATWRNWCRKLNPKDLERVGYEPGRSQFMVKPEPVNPFKVTPQNCPPRQKTEEELEAERSFDLFERVLNGEV